jgi:hypothetical protein
MVGRLARSLTTAPPHGSIDDQSNNCVQKFVLNPNTRGYPAALVLIVGDACC